MRLFFVLLFLVLLSPQVLAKQPIVVFHAGSLSVPLNKIAAAFEKEYPQYKVVLEASGSRMAARKISDLHRPADVMASADYSVIDNLLIDTGNARFNALFATNEMVIAFTDKSRFANKINPNNWVDILLRKGVVVGHSNPNDDPCGYRAMLVAKLAEKYYNKKGFFKELFGYPDYYQNGFEKKGKVIVRPKETDLLALLNMHYIDYIFIYKSVAIQHNLRFIELPKEVCLCCKQFNKIYNTVSFKVSGKKPNEFITKRGSAMIYGLTIPENDNSPVNRKGAVLFVKFILSKKGQQIIKSCGQGVISPPIIKGNDEILKEQ
ncbi:tungstate ABC transporter substrate-binding protein WtpA [Hippea sp. KM1]|uniref:tungstate ABC transporter substrate-binding protein WtpA n=1 Tax=Hippea sp. KM1 TaxID=944481 RepID=UPI00046C92D6|nr:tungstate ABC transporter substrate-binding protein WtpA [Hippea sp. KM1]